MKAILRSGFLALAIMAPAVPANATTERFGPFIYDPQFPKDLNRQSGITAIEDILLNFSD